MSIRPAKAIFFDRDGVIIVDKHFAVRPSELELLPYVIDALKMVPGGYLKIIVSNQSGVGRGYFTIEQVNLFNDNLLDELKKNGVFMDKLYYCPHKPEDRCQCRKPEIGMFKQAEKDFNIDLTNSWVIGDKSSDIKAGQNIGARTILVTTGYGGREPGAVNLIPDYIVENLKKAVEIVVNES